MKASAVYAVEAKQTAVGMLRYMSERAAKRDRQDLATVFAVRVVVLTREIEKLRAS